MAIIIGSVLLDDILNGTNGADSIFGLDGDDQLYGGNGDDLLYGGVDDDRLFGGNGKDLLSGDIGDDQLYGGNAEDSLAGGLGDDRLFGGNATDTLSGGAGDDDLLGENGTDVLDGGDGDDRLDGGHGVDTMTGGAGTDTFVMSHGGDVVTDFSPTVTIESVIDFEGIVADGDEGAIPDGYAGMDWSDFFFAIDDDHFAVPGSGYENARSSGEAVGYTAFALPVEFSSPGADFDLLSGNFAAAWNTELNVIIEAWDDGVQVGEADLTFDFLQVQVDFAAGTAVGVDVALFTGTFASIDEVRITPSGGFNAGLGGDGSHLAMDDLVLAFTSGDGDVIDAPDGIDIDDLVASAVDDGFCNAVVSQGGYTMTLEGMDADDVSADWFV